MKQGIHPNYFTKAAIICSCGAVLETGSTVETMRTEICSQCHPLYTGKKKLIDTTGRVDRFKKLAEKSAAAKIAHKKANKKVSAQDGFASGKKNTAARKEKKVSA